MRVTVTRRRETDEWVVRSWHNNKLVSEYFTDDKRDAYDTASDILRRVAAAFVALQAELS